jgi:hypothetical protein
VQRSSAFPVGSRHAYVAMELNLACRRREQPAAGLDLRGRPAQQTYPHRARPATCCRRFAFHRRNGGAWLASLLFPFLLPARTGGGGGPSPLPFRRRSPPSSPAAAVRRSTTTGGSCHASPIRRTHTLSSEEDVCSSRVILIKDRPRRRWTTTPASTVR